MVQGANRPTHVILVVEDEFLVRMAICTALDEAGYKVVDTDHADWALTYLREHARETHALFTDIHVPGSMDGLALAHVSSKAWPWISLLIASARARPQPHELPQGCRFLPKPYEHEEVIHHLRELVASA